MRHMVFSLVAASVAAVGACSTSPEQAVPHELEEHTGLRGEIRFVVVDGRTNQPVAGAEVLWLDVPESRVERYYGCDVLRSWSARLHPDLDALAASVSRSGNRTVSDAEGRVRLPSVSLPSFLARKGALLGCTQTFQAEKGDRSVVRLWPDEEFGVRVLDVSGAPVPDVVVALARHSGTAAADSWHTELRRTTDASGAARLEHARVLMAAPRSSDVSEPVRWRICVEAIPGDTAHCEIDACDLPEEPITLQLPATGEVELMLLESDGRPAELAMPVELQEFDAAVWTPEHPPPRIMHPNFSPDPGVLQATAVGGRVLFRNIGLDRELIAFAARNEWSRVQTLRIPGPTANGERVRGTLVLGSDSVIFHGQATGMDGDPLGNARLRVDLFCNPSPERQRVWNAPPDQPWPCRGGSLVTDSEGHFTIEYSPSDTLQGRPSLLLGILRPGEVALETNVDLSEMWQSGRHELGVVQLAEAPLLASGVVVDPQGNPVSGALVSLDSLRGGLQSVEGVATDEQGRFEFRSAEPRKHSRLRVGKPGFETSRTEDRELGHSDWRVELHPTCTIVVQAFLPPGAAPSMCHVSIVRTSASASSWGWSSGGSLDPDGTYRCDDIGPGTYCVRVFYDGLTEDRLVWDSTLNARRSETTMVGPIDLRRH